MAGLCRNGLHEMTRDNLTTENRCRACRNASYRAKRAKARVDPLAAEKNRLRQLPHRAWRDFMQAKTPNVKMKNLLRLIGNDWLPEAKWETAVAEIARVRMQYLPERPESPTERMLDAARELISRAVEDEFGVDKKNPFKHLHVKPDAEKAWERFDKALRLAAETGENVPNCQGRSAEFVDYDDDDLPSAEDAYRMCYGDESRPRCKLLELCAVYAEQERPAWGVHAGEVWVAGEIVNK
ncbi:hypothetical protein Pan2_45 [Pseudanabaena phage Pan2]|nr:hypothetical protein Pan2_45 [Pseudanabaena phage Pan2]